MPRWHCWMLRAPPRRGLSRLWIFVSEGRVKPSKRARRKRTTVKQLDSLCKQILIAQFGPKCQLANAGIGTCGGHLQACHILPKGTYPDLRFDLQNILLGCWRHHAPQSPVGWHSNPMDYSQWFMATYPKRWYYLSQFKMHGRDSQKPDLEAIGLRLTELLAAT